MLGFMPSLFAQGFWQRLGRAVVGVAAGAAESYVGSTLNEQDRKAWNDISNDINNGLGLNNGYVNAGNKLQEGETRNAVVDMGVTAASNSGNRTLITVSNTVKAQNDYVNNVSSGMDRKTAQEVAAKQISDVLLDDMEARESIADEKRRQERIAAENRNEYNSSSNTYSTSSSTSNSTQYGTPSKTQYNASSRTESKETPSANTYSNMSQNHLTFNDKAEECQNQIREYQQRINIGIPPEFLQYRIENMISLYNGLTEEYRNQTEEYQQLVNSYISSEFLKYKEESLNNMYKNIIELKQQLDEVITNYYGEYIAKQITRIIK